ncbi:MAG: hypothetical protein NVSMB25_10810 [Thermoleophilaceae bacterium]
MDGGFWSVSGPGALARVLGVLYLAGATLALASMVLPQPSGTDVAGLFGVYAAAYLGGGLLLVFRDRLSDWASVPALAFATVLITAGMLLTEARTGVYSVLYVWVALTAAYFLSWLHLALQTSLIGAFYAGALIAERPASAPEQWLIVVGTVVLVGLLVAVMRRGHIRLVERLVDSSRTDALTGLLNRRGFKELLDVELERSSRAERPLCLLVIDIDQFKQVNDAYGHPTGDRALRLFARTLSETVRRIDRAARIGGEEFAVVLPDTPSHSAYLLAERLRRRIAEDSPAHPVELAISIGIACSPEHGRTSDDLMHAADRALFAAKTLGRDRAVLYDPKTVGSVTATDGGPDHHREENVAAVMVLAETLDIRDTGTARHSQSVARYAGMIAARLGLSEAAVKRLRLAGVLHDIGKIGVPDSILRKPGQLTDSEYAEMKAHAELGARILAGAHLDDLSGWVLAHHERPDGCGYPHRISSHEIPMEAKILAVADAYEAMTSDRVYRDSIGTQAAQEELLRCAGSQFDPEVVRALLEALAAEAAPPARSGALSWLDERTPLAPGPASP